MCFYNTDLKQCAQLVFSCTLWVFFSPFIFHVWLVHSMIHVLPHIMCVVSSLIYQAQRIYTMCAVPTVTALQKKWAQRCTWIRAEELEQLCRPTSVDSCWNHCAEWASKYGSKWEIVENNWNVKYHYCYNFKAVYWIVEYLCAVLQKLFYFYANLIVIIQCILKWN